MAKLSIHQLLRSRSTRVLAIWGLILIQAQLLWVTELHHDGEDQICPTPSALTRADQVQGPGNGERPVCLACRVAQESAAVAVTNSPAAAPDLVVRFVLTCSSAPYAASDGGVIPARAPPAR
ncbi:MAG: hypothetical protein ACE145_14870 [Terriglobia bacterium]